MANRKQPYSWGKVSPGDIISFRYKPKSGNPPKVQTILVLNPKLPVNLKNGKTTQHLIGVKLEESNRVSLRLTNKQVGVLEKIGNFVSIDEQNNLFKLEIKSQFVTSDVKGVKPRAYDVISNSLDIQGQYRTYDYGLAKRSAVYLEPIKIVIDVDEEVDDEY
jgi:hypothetical protein|tara:strand:+ start:243 stop:728 length:486 start_codon:yes stop_codon:yes gene_type:complete